MIPVQTELIYPMFCLFLITVGVLIRVFLVRVSDIKEGRTAYNYYKTYNQGVESPLATQAVRHYANLFESPVLFYIACILGMILPVQTVLFTVLAWLYVIARLAHAYIHLTKNKIKSRMLAFAFGLAVLVAMWLSIVLKALNIASGSIGE